MFRKKDKQPEGRRTGTLSNRQASTLNYRSNRSDRPDGIGRYNREEQEARSVEDRTKILKNIPTYIALAVLVVSIIYAISLNTTPQVQIVGNSSNSFLQSSDVYKESAEKLLNSSWLNQNKLTIDTSKIEAELTKQFPELSGVSVVLPLLGHKPIIEIKPSQSTIVLSNSQGRYVINQNGSAVLKLQTADQNNKYNLPVVTDNSGLEVKLGEQVVPTATITFIDTVITQLTAKNIPIQSMTLVDIPYELNVQVRGEPYYVKFSLLADPNYSVGTYLATVKELATLKATPTQYIDIRIPGRSYYL